MKLMMSSDMLQLQSRLNSSYSSRYKRGMHKAVSGIKDKDMWK